MSKVYELFCSVFFAVILAFSLFGMTVARELGAETAALVVVTVMASSILLLLLIEVRDRKKTARRRRLKRKTKANKVKAA